MEENMPDIYEQQKQHRREAYHRAPHIKDRYPQLASLTLDMSFKEPGWGGDPPPQQRAYGPDNKAFFEMECPHRECVAGGFDLSAAVSEVVTNGETRAAGKLVCQGWQDREHINKDQCHLQMNYRITATYKLDA